jgi:hypothetical protein
LENLKARNLLEDIDIDERIILKLILIMLSIDMDWIYWTGSREHVNGHLGSIKCREFLAYLRTP